MRIRFTKAAVAVAAGAVLVGAFSAAASPPGRRAYVARLSSADGDSVGTVRLTPADEDKVRVSITAEGLTPGFHGFHVHASGVCDPEAKDATGAPVPFFSAGGHYNPDTSQIHGGHAGDMPPLLVTQDGDAMLRFKTDRFALADLMDADGSAIIVHAGPDNLANIPASTSTGGERYHSHVDGVFGPDTATKATGDAGARFACGVIEKG